MEAPPPTKKNKREEKKTSYADFESICVRNKNALGEARTMNICYILRMWKHLATGTDPPFLYNHVSVVN